MLSRIRIVLVSPSSPGNIGSVCRVMANMGLSDLVVVAPRCDPTHEHAVAFAAHGARLLDRMRIVDNLQLALADGVRSYAATSRLGLYRRQAAEPPDAAARDAVEFIHARSNPTRDDPTRSNPARDDLGESAGNAVQNENTPAAAFAFGREDYGLKLDELLLFDRLITIPADDAYPVLNLATAVAIVAYELRRAWLAAADLPPLPMAISGPPARGQQKDKMFEMLFDALERVGFFFGPNPDHLRHALRKMLGRIDLTVNEADILLGLARQIRWYTDHHPRRVDP